MLILTAVNFFLPTPLYLLAASVNELVYTNGAVLVLKAFGCSAWSNVWLICERCPYAVCHSMEMNILHTTLSILPFLTPHRQRLRMHAWTFFKMGGFSVNQSYQTLHKIKKRILEMCMTLPELCSSEGVPPLSWMEGGAYGRKWVLPSLRHAPQQLCY